MEDNQEAVSSIDTLSEIPTGVVNEDGSDNQVMAVKDKTNANVKNSTFNNYFNENGELKSDVKVDQLIFEGDFKDVSIIINRPVELISKDATLINSTIELVNGADNVIIDGFKFNTARENAIIIDTSNNIQIINNNFIYTAQNKNNIVINAFDGKNIVVKNNIISMKSYKTDSDVNGVIYLESVDDSKILNNTITAEIPSSKTGYVGGAATYNSYIIQVSGDNNTISKNEISFKYSCLIGDYDTIYSIIAIGDKNTISKNNIKGIGNSYVYGIKCNGGDGGFYGLLYKPGSVEISDNNINLISNYEANGIEVSGGSALSEDYEICESFEATILRNNLNLTANNIVYGTNDDHNFGILSAKYINNTFILSSNSVYGMEILGDNETLINNNIIANGNYTLGIGVSYKDIDYLYDGEGIASILNNTIKVNGKGLGNATGGDYQLPSINAGIYIKDSESAIVSGNTIVAEIPAAPYDVKVGGIVSDVSDIVIENNNIDVTESSIAKGYDSLYGVKISGNDVIFRNNTIFVKGGVYGYAVDAAGENIAIKDCNIAVNNQNFYGCGINIYSFTGTVDNNIIDITAEGAAYGTASGYYNYKTVTANYTNNVVTVNANTAYGLQFSQFGEENAIGNKIVANGNYTMGITVYSRSVITKNTIESNGIGKTYAETEDVFGATNQGILIYKDIGTTITDNFIKTTGNYSVNVLKEENCFLITVKNNCLIANKLAGNAAVNNISAVHPYIKDKVNIANNTPESRAFIESEDIVTDFGDKTEWVAILTDVDGKPIANATLIFNVNGADYKRTTDANGTAILNINLNPGVYKSTVKFLDNSGYYENATKTVTITACPEKAFIESEDVVKYFRDATEWVAILTDSKGKPIANADLVFNVNGVDYKRTTDVNGTASMEINSNPGVYKGTVNFLTNNKHYENVTKTVTITVYPAITPDPAKAFIESDDVVTYFRNETKWVAILTDGEGKPIANAALVFNVNGVDYKRTTDVNGTAGIDINLNPGVYNGTVKFTDSKGHYENAIKTVTITVYPAITPDPTKAFIESEDVVTYINDDAEWVAILTDGEGKPIANATLVFSINGVDYKKTTDVNGTAGIDINLNPGVYNGTVKFTDSTGYYKNATRTVTITVYSEKAFIESENIVKYFKNGTKWVAILTDGEGKPIANATLVFSINGVDYKKTTDVNGTASMNINLNPGVYKGTVKFADNKGYYENVTTTATITVLSVIKSQDIELMFRNGTKFTATILDGQGKPLANAFVQLNINGVIYNRTTDANGTCALNINLNPGKYVITTIYNGARQANNITVHSVLTENTDLVKYYRNESQYVVKVVDGHGKALANAKVSFNINGVFYERTTNANGTATMNINLGPGTYIITAIYNGCMVANKITVLSTVQSKDIEMTTSNRIPFVATILDGQGKPLSGAKLSFNVNGVIYERISAADGTAKLNINLQAGEYIITTMYNGLFQGNTITVKP